VKREERAARSLERSSDRNEGRGAGCRGDRDRDERRRRGIEADTGRRLLGGSRRGWLRRHDAAAVIARFDPRRRAVMSRRGLLVAGTRRRHARAVGHRRAERHGGPCRHHEDGEEGGSQAAEVARRFHYFRFIRGLVRAGSGHCRSQCVRRRRPGGWTLPTRSDGRVARQTARWLPHRRPSDCREPRALPSSGRSRPAGTTRSTCTDP
jgi:hypothetical protein